MENKNWPDEIRLEMVEKSEFYQEPKIYQYGYYDGYQKAASQFTQPAIEQEGKSKEEFDIIPPQFVGDKSRKIKRVTVGDGNKIDRLHEEKYFAVEYAGFWHIQAGPYYGDTDILDAEQVGEDEAEMPNINLNI